MLIETIGIIATVLIVASFATSGEKNIRKLNLMGAILMTIYGLLKGAFSCCLSNGILIAIQLYKINTSKE